MGLTRIAASKKLGRGGQVLKQKDARVQSKRVIERMKEKVEIDREDAKLNKPALAKAEFMKELTDSVRRRGFGDAFVLDRGVDQLAAFLRPIEDAPEDRRLPSDGVVLGVLECLEVLKRYIKEEVIIGSKIGILVKNEMKNTDRSRDLREKAQSVLNSWVQSALGNKQQDDEAREAAAEREEADEVVDVHQAFAGACGSNSQGEAQQQQHKRSEAELARIWQPSVKQQEEFESRATNRHARMPIVKPTFSMDAKPLSSAPPKKAFKEDPLTSFGKIEQQLAKITNPNKKTWKSAIEEVSISGRGIVYKW